MLPVVKAGDPKLEKQSPPYQHQVTFTCQREDSAEIVETSGHGFVLNWCYKTGSSCVPLITMGHRKGIHENVQSTVHMNERHRNIT